MFTAVSLLPARRWHDSSGINGRSLLPVPGVERLRPMKDPVITGESRRQKQHNSWTQESGCLPSLRTVPERPERDALARFQTRDPVFLFSRHYSRVHIWHGSDDIRRQGLLPGSKNNREKAFSVCRKTIRTDYWCYLQEQHNTKQQWRDTAAADQTSWGGNIRYVESNAISSFLVERLPHEDLRRKELWRQQHKQQLGVFVGKKADYSPQIHIRTWLGAEFSPNIVHVRDGLNIDFRIDSCSLFDAALVCFSHPSSMF